MKYLAAYDIELNALYKVPVTGTVAVWLGYRQFIYNVLTYLIQLLFSFAVFRVTVRVRVSSRVRVSFSFVIWFHFSVYALSYKGDSLQLLPAG